MPGLLARLAPDRGMALLDEGAEPAGAPRPGLLDAVRREGRRRRIRRTRLRIGIAAAAAAVVLVAVLVPLAVMRPAAVAETVAFEAVADVPVTATAVLTPVGWGTRIDLDCRYGSAESTDAVGTTGDGWPYVLVVVDRDGARSEVSSWRAMPGATARLQAWTAVALDDIASLEIRTVSGGDVLLSARAD